MNTHIQVVCTICRAAQGLAWDHDAFLVEDPLGGETELGIEQAEGPVRNGDWPDPHGAPSPLAAGAWAALAVAARPFVAEHLRHPETGLELVRAQGEPPPHPAAPFDYPPAVRPKRPPRLANEHGIRRLTTEERLAVAGALGTAGLLAVIDGAGTDAGSLKAACAALVLAGYLPPDPALDERLLALALDRELGPLAEEALALRICLQTPERAARVERLRGVAEIAFARLMLSNSRRRTTPYDRIAPQEQLQARAVEILASSNRVDEACDLLERWKRPPEAAPLLRQALAARILDEAQSAEARMRTVRRARGLFPGLIDELRRGGALATRPLPDPAHWENLRDADRALAVLTADPALLAAALADPDPQTVAFSLKLVDQLAFVAPEAATPFEPAVRALCRDTRTQPGSLARRICVLARETHGPLFRAMGGGERAWEALIAVLDAMIAAGLGMSLGMHFRALKANGIDPARLAELLYRRVADRALPASERLQAREALGSLAAEGASEVRNEPRPSPEAQAAARRADDRLIAALHDPDEPEALKQGIRAALTRWMPDRPAELQGGAIARAPCPSIHELPGGPPLAEIDQADLIRQLREPQSPVDRVLGALYLAPYLGRFATALLPTLEPLVRSRIGDGRPCEDRGRTLVVAEEARRAHREIWSMLPAADRPPAPALLDALRTAALGQTRLDAEEEGRAAFLLATVSYHLSQADLALFADGLAPLIADPGAPPAARLEAFKALERLPGQSARAEAALFAVLADLAAPPELRAAAHALLARRMPQAVHDLQAKGLLPRIELPPAEALFNVWFDRDPAGERLLSNEARRIADCCYPEDLIAALMDAQRDPARACAAAALAPLVVQRLPAWAGRIREGLATAAQWPVERRVMVEGRELVYGLEELCRQALAEVQEPGSQVGRVSEA